MPHSAPRREIAQSSQRMLKPTARTTPEFVNIRRARQRHELRSQDVAEVLAQRVRPHQRSVLLLRSKVCLSHMPARLASLATVSQMTSSSRLSVG